MQTGGSRVNCRRDCSRASSHEPAEGTASSFTTMNSTRALCATQAGIGRGTVFASTRCRRESGQVSVARPARPPDRPTHCGEDCLHQVTTRHLIATDGSVRDCCAANKSPLIMWRVWVPDERGSEVPTRPLSYDSACSSHVFRHLALAVTGNQLGQGNTAGDQGTARYKPTCIGQCWSHMWPACAGCASCA